MTELFYCRTEFDTVKAPAGFWRGRLWHAKMRRQMKHNPPVCRNVMLREGEVSYYLLSRDAVLAEEQIALLKQEGGGRSRFWYEEALADRLGIIQPEPDALEIACILRQMLLEPPSGAGKRESLLVIEPREKDALAEAYFDILERCIADLNHVTILTEHPERYERLRESVYEREGLLLTCMRELKGELPLGRRLLVANFRPLERLRRETFETGTFCFSVCARGIVKFLDTTVKNRYNIYS